MEVPINAHVSLGDALPAKLLSTLCYCASAIHASTKHCWQLSFCFGCTAIQLRLPVTQPIDLVVVTKDLGFATKDLGAAIENLGVATNNLGSHKPRISVLQLRI